jgi:hypothetical protein
MISPPQRGETYVLTQPFRGRPEGTEFVPTGESRHDWWNGGHCTAFAATVDGEVVWFDAAGGELHAALRDALTSGAEGGR